MWEATYSDGVTTDLITTLRSFTLLCEKRLTGGQAYYASELVMNLKSFIVLMALGLCEK